MALAAAVGPAIVYQQTHRYEMGSQILSAMKAAGFRDAGDESDDEGDGGAFRLLYSRCEDILWSFREYEGKLGQINQ